jgi:hypothetical protein
MYVLLRVVPEHVVAMECKGAVATPRIPLTPHMSLDSITLRTGICIRLNLFPLFYPIHFQPTAHFESRVPQSLEWLADADIWDTSALRRGARWSNRYIPASCVGVARLCSTLGRPVVLNPRDSYELNQGRLANESMVRRKSGYVYS